nr:hypothetical protein [Desulfobacula sp.]
MKPKTKFLVFFFLLASVAAIGLLHALTPGHLGLYHDTYRRLSYFPIAIGAVFFRTLGRAKPGRGVLPRLCPPSLFILGQ